MLASLLLIAKKEATAAMSQAASSEKPASLSCSKSFSDKDYDVMYGSGLGIGMIRVKESGFR